jgi:hypothetical protein
MYIYIYISLNLQNKTIVIKINAFMSTKLSFKINLKGYVCINRLHDSVENIESIRDIVTTFRY